MTRKIFGSMSTHLFGLDAQLVAVLELMVFAEVNNYFARIYHPVILFVGHTMSGCGEK